MHSRYIVIGISNKKNDCLPDQLAALLEQHSVFSGGARHYELVKQWLPAYHTWIPIKGDMEVLFAAYRQASMPVVVFASGDPLFYGMVQTIQKYDETAAITVHPHFNSLQRLCAKIGQPYQQVKNTSVHGRNWQELDEALLRGEPLIAVLTDAVRDPRAIAERLIDYNFLQYEMVIGEDLDGAHEEIRTGAPSAILQWTFQPLNCILLRQVRPALQPGVGIADHLFTGLEGRPNMITKKAIRLLSLSCLQLHRSRVFWDIGFCTGSVAIEARRLFPHLQVVAFEKRGECLAIIQQNMQQLSAPGIEICMGDFFIGDHALLPAPDAVFIGGHGDRLEALMQLIDRYLIAGGRIVMNVVLESSHRCFAQQAAALNWECAGPQTIQIDQHNPITVLTAIKLS